MTHPDILLPTRIAGLDDDHAVTVLARVAARRGYQPDPVHAAQHEQHLREALAQPEITTTVTPVPAGRGDLARTALTHLATTDPNIAAQIDQALTTPLLTAERDPTLLLGIGALVLFAFHADITLARDPTQGWSFTLHTKAISDSTIGKFLGQLLGTYLDPDK